MRRVHISCPYCGGIPNQMWLSDVDGKNAYFVVECWSGDLHTKSNGHYFLAKVRLQDKAANLACFEEKLAAQVKDALTNGWSKGERETWREYLDEEIKSNYPLLYTFLKEEG